MICTLYPDIKNSNYFAVIPGKFEKVDIGIELHLDFLKIKINE